MVISLFSSFCLNCVVNRRLSSSYRVMDMYKAVMLLKLVFVVVFFILPAAQSAQIVSQQSTHALRMPSQFSVSMFSFLIGKHECPLYKFWPNGNTNSIVQDITRFLAYIS